MWLTSSSIGRKFVMALTGICLVLFVTFHVLMNAVALLWPTAYNSICEFLGANWYALVASAGLALLFIIHIIYACWLTIQNRAARGTDRYAVTSRPPQVEWASKNMLILGVVILAFLVVHLIQFWAKMQLVEVCHTGLDKMPHLNEVPVPPTMGTLMLQLAFSEWWTPVVYIIGFIALWFHMNHGFWSMLHSVGWDNNKWLPRLKAIGCWWTSIVVLLFIAQAVTFTVLSNKNYYTENIELQNQYAGYWNEYCAEVAQEYIDGQTKVLAPYMKTYNDATEAINKAYETNKSADEIGKLQETCDKAREEMRTAATQYTQQNGPALITKAEYVQKMFEKQFHKAAIFQAQPMASQIEGFQLLLGIYQQVKQQIDKPQIQPNY